MELHELWLVQSYDVGYRHFRKRDCEPLHPQVHRVAARGWANLEGLHTYLVRLRVSSKKLAEFKFKLVSLPLTYEC